MVTIHADPVPLEAWPDGSIRVGGTRVTLETILTRYIVGDSAEEIADGFPTVGLANVHGVIAYYHRHRGEVQTYLDAAWASQEAARNAFFATPEGARLKEVLDRAEQSEATR